MINLVVGVRDQTNRAGGRPTIENVAANYDTQKISVTVTNGAVVNLTPIATPGFAAVSTGSPTTVQLAGQHGQSRVAGPDAPVRDPDPADPRHGLELQRLDRARSPTRPNAGFLGNDTPDASTSRDVGDPDAEPRPATRPSRPSS